MRIKVPYGDGWQEAVLEGGIPVQVVEPPCGNPQAEAEELIEEALAHPIGTPLLEEMAAGKRKVLILVNDQTRPGPNRQMAEAIIKRLKRAEIRDDQIRILIATGSHRAPNEEELEQLLGKEILRRIPVSFHDCHRDNQYVGTTQGGLPVYVDRLAIEADFIITTGLIAPHKAAGFSGGRKSIVPGIAGMETLKIHHSLPIRPKEPAMGWLEGNPFHEAASQAARMVGVNFILNAVQDVKKQNVAMVAGDLEQAFQKGVEICRAYDTVTCRTRGELVIASPGGAPRDCNLYQAQKALAVAEVFTKKGGESTMILTARAEDGIGPELFQEWLREAKTPEEVIERFRREGFDVGTNKAFEYARAMTKGRIIIVSEGADPERLREMKLDWAPDLQSAVDMAVHLKKPEQVIVLPKAVSIIPQFEDEEDEVF